MNQHIFLSWPFAGRRRAGVLRQGGAQFGHTIVRESTSMPNLTEENTTLVMNCLHNWLPGLHLLFCENSWSMWITVVDNQQMKHVKQGGGG